MASISRSHRGDHSNAFSSSPASTRCSQWSSKACLRKDLGPPVCPEERARRKSFMAHPRKCRSSCFFAACSCLSFHEVFFLLRAGSPRYHSRAVFIACFFSRSLEKPQLHLTGAVSSIGLTTNWQMHSLHIG